MITGIVTNKSRIKYLLLIKKLAIFVHIKRRKPLMIRSFNKAKAINSLILIAQKIANQDGVADKYKALKILYFSELKHLSKYGRLITDDDFATLDHGTTPSASYDLLKKRDDQQSFEIINKYHFRPKVALDADELSESDVECLLEAIDENKNLDFASLKQKAHDEAYNMAASKKMRLVPIEYLVKQQKLKPEQIAFINEQYEFIESIQWLNL